MTSFTPSSGDRDDPDLRNEASRWVVRRDRRLSPAEQAELETWLGQPGHAEAFDRSCAAWRAFRLMGAAVRRAPDPVQVAASKWNCAWVGTMAAAAAIALGFVFLGREEVTTSLQTLTMAAPATEVAPPPKRLADGSTVSLKPGAKIEVRISALERRIQMRQGEAYFVVATDAVRPFVVETDNGNIRAVGTAFAVRLDRDAVDVLVTEGTVEVSPPGPASNAALTSESPEKSKRVHAVPAGHRAVVARVQVPRAPAVVVSAVSPAEIAQALAWNQPMLDLAGATLGEVVARFEERTGRRIQFVDSELKAVRIGGQFPTHDLDGFVRAIEQVYEVKSELRADGVIILRKTQ